jgi:hypothetical protein
MLSEHIAADAEVSEDAGACKSVKDDILR